MNQNNFSILRVIRGRKKITAPSKNKLKSIYFEKRKSESGASVSSFRERVEGSDLPAGDYTQE